jgi:branched-chain amino acid transport system substrate-binding protein
LGLTIGPDVIVDLRATDATLQLLGIKDFNPDFIWIGGTTPSAAVVIRCAIKLGLSAKFLINTWGIDDYLLKETDKEAEGRVFGFSVVRPFGYDTAAMNNIKANTGDQSYSLHFNKSWASMMVLWEGLKRAKKLNGSSLKAALETLREFETGGLTPPLTYTPEDHRPTTTCGLYTIKDGRLILVSDVSVDREDELLGR